MEFTVTKSILLAFSTAAFLIAALGLFGWASSPWDGDFNYDDARICAETSYNSKERRRRRPLDPALDYVPFYDLYANKDCSDFSVPIRERVDPDFVQCGLHHYGPYKKMQLNWAFGPDHHPQHSPGSAKGANWKALSEIGKSLYAQDGFMLGRFVLEEQGALRDPHWHSNAAEFTYIVKGTARVTVTGLPKTDVAYGAYYKRSIFTGQETAAPEIEREGTRSVETPGRDSETFILRPGDAFYSPLGYHHFFEGVDPEDPLVGIAVFDTSDLKTFDTPQMMKAMPKEMLAQVLQVPHADVNDWYRGFRRAFVDPHAEWSEERLKEALENDVNADLRFKIPAINQNLTQAPRADTNGRVHSRALDAFTWTPLGKARFSFAYTEIAPGATLEPYWVDNADELIFVLEGDNLEIVRSGNGKSDCKDIFTLKEGFLAINEIGKTWFMKNNGGSSTAKLLRIFNSNQPSVSTLYDAFHSLPEDVVATMLQAKYYNQYEYFK